MLMCKTHQCLVIKYNIPTACFLSNFLDFITPVSDHLSQMEQKQRGSAHPSREREDDSHAPQGRSLLKPLKEEIKRKQMP